MYMIFLLVERKNDDEFFISGEEKTNEFFIFFCVFVLFYVSDKSLSGKSDLNAVRISQIELGV